MSKRISTEALIEGLKQMLENRGSLTAEEVTLLSDVVVRLQEHENLKGDRKLQNGMVVVQLLMRFLMDPAVSAKLSHIVSTLIDKLN